MKKIIKTTNIGKFLQVKKGEWKKEKEVREREKERKWGSKLFEERLFLILLTFRDNKRKS